MRPRDKSLASLARPGSPLIISLDAILDLNEVEYNEFAFEVTKLVHEKKPNKIILREWKSSLPLIKQKIVTIDNILNLLFTLPAPDNKLHVMVSDLDAEEVMTLQLYLRNVNRFFNRQVCYPDIAKISKKFLETTPKQTQPTSSDAFSWKMIPVPVSQWKLEVLPTSSARIIKATEDTVAVKRSHKEMEGDKFSEQNPTKIARVSERPGISSPPLKVEDVVSPLLFDDIVSPDLFKDAIVPLVMKDKMDLESNPAVDEQRESPTATELSPAVSTGPSVFMEPVRQASNPFIQFRPASSASFLGLEEDYIISDFEIDKFLQ